ncbi:MAG: radical SAM protein [Planctomycetota bacterium]
MAKVLFIYPNINAQESFSHGIASMSGALKAMGIQTRLIHLNERLFGSYSLEKIAKEVIEFDPLLICFSVMSQQYKYALEIAADLKRRFPYPLAIGGVHTTMVPHEVAAAGIFDYIGLGECDNALPALVKAIREERDVTSVPNIWARTESGDYKRNPVGPFPDLESLAPKDYEIFDLDRMLPEMNGWMSMITSRGCPYRCTYCFNHQLMKRYRAEAGQKPKEYLRRYPVRRVIAEMKRLKELHPALSVFIIDDDLFTVNEEYVLEFCDAYSQAGIDLPFVVNGHVQVFNRTMAEALKAAGCKILKFGLESGSERIRKIVLKREMSNVAIEKAFAIAHEAGLHTSAFIMIGLPLEEREDIDATLDLLARIEPGRFRWALFYPFPGTEIHALCEERSLIDPEKMKALDNFFEASPLRFSPDQDLYLQKLQRTLHWHVNARTSFDTAPLFQEKIREINALNAEEWREKTKNYLDEERSLSEQLVKEGGLHYSIRFIQVMAVRSDYDEDESQGLAKPAKEWKSRPGNSL